MWPFEHVKKLINNIIGLINYIYFERADDSCEKVGYLTVTIQTGH